MPQQDSSFTVEKATQKAERRKAWAHTERKLTPENKTEFVIYSLFTALALLGFSALLSFFFEWATLEPWHLGAALVGGVCITLGSVHGQKLRDDLDQQEINRHGFTLDEDRKATHGATPLT